MDQSPSTFQLLAAAIFAVAILHTFATKYFEGLAHRYPRHGGIWHLLGEVEVVFGFWALVLMLAMFGLVGVPETKEYLNTRNFTEPLFVFAIMVIAATRPILYVAGELINLLARLLPLPGRVGYFLVVMIFVPLLGSFITEPAAMTLAALIISQQFFAQPLSQRFKYATLAVLFVNISIGGTLTPFAAPPVLMVAGQWGWDLHFMLTQFGWKAAIAVTVNAVGLTLLFWRELAQLQAPSADSSSAPKVPMTLVITHLLFLLGVVVFAHYPPIFMGLLLFFIGITHAYERHQDRLILREALLVAFFLAGLVVLGGHQQWWLQPVLMSMSSDAVFFGATALTAFTDNAALTYLGSLVPGLSPEFQYALVAGAVAGGGLTVIANAPNPAGLTILRGHFSDGTVNAGYLALAALTPTLVAMAALRFL
ncbi:putative Na+/H+ antiporter [Chitinibacter sp. ZOR0017]|uniref:putative Na+/H+ antiporter n=1 Tax=Chitinibacter sp. ZOR0017 TaxID=1339254 RepID=UPI000647870F|nr:putative Na+/H+ antiporter [Chitinibacter sp. ZOR0017]